MSGWQEWFAQRRKFFVALIGAAIGVATTMGWDTNHYVQLGITVATLLGLYVVPNKQKVVAPNAPSPSPAPGV